MSENTITDGVWRVYPRGGGPWFGEDGEIVCEWPKVMVHTGTGESFPVRCQTSSRAKCGPCSKAYRGRVSRVFLSGWADRRPGKFWSVTLTAPGTEAHCRVHRRCDGSGGRRGECELCPCTPPGGVDLALWNGTAARRFNDFVTELRRAEWIAGDVQYAKAAEIQERGALHFHVLLRVGNQQLRLAELRALAIRLGFGHSVDLQSIGATSEAMRAAWYCAKYVSKSADDRSALPWFDVRTGEVTKGHGRYRTWTSSRSWGESMKAIRLAQQVYAEARRLAGDGAPSGVSTASGGGAAALDPKTESYAETGFG